VGEFDEWMNRDMHKGHLFITDGVIDKEAWFKSNDRIMFLLKEAYDSKRKEGSWDLPSLIRSRGVSGRTFKPMAQWAYGISKLLEDGEISQYKESGEEARNALLSSAVINLKKSQGKKSSGPGNLQQYVDEDWVLISKKNAEIAKKANKAGDKLWKQSQEISVANKEVKLLIDLTEKHIKGLKALLRKLKKAPKDYQKFSDKQKEDLGALINHVQSLAKLLHKKVDHE